MTDLKPCTLCGKEKPLSAFTKRSGSSSRRGTCRACIRKRKRSTLKLPGVEELLSDETTAVMEEPQQLDQLTAAAELSAPAAPRKRKRKRRRARGNSSRRKREIAKESLPSSAVRPPDRLIIPMKGKFSYQTSLLNDRGRGLIRLRGHRETGKRWSTEIPTEMAIRMVEEGAAGIIHPGLIHKLYTKTDFRLLVLQRDDYVCRYCGNFGDTIDHVMPKSKGGLSTPANCVCACSDCNLKKADSLDYVDDEMLQHFHFQT